MPIRTVIERIEPTNSVAIVRERLLRTEFRDRPLPAAVLASEFLRLESPSDDCSLDDDESADVGLINSLFERCLIDDQKSLSPDMPVRYIHVAIPSGCMRGWPSFISLYTVYIGKSLSGGWLAQLAYTDYNNTPGLDRGQRYALVGVKAGDSDHYAVPKDMLSKRALNRIGLHCLAKDIRQCIPELASVPNGYLAGIKLGSHLRDSVCSIWNAVRPRAESRNECGLHSDKHPRSSK